MASKHIKTWATIIPAAWVSLLWRPEDWSKAWVWPVSVVTQATFSWLSWLPFHRRSLHTTSDTWGLHSFLIMTTCRIKQTHCCSERRIHMENNSPVISEKMNDSEVKQHVNFQFPFAFPLSKITYFARCYYISGFTVLELAFLVHIQLLLYPFISFGSHDS